MTLHILHALFTPYQGGLEQAYVNVTEALASRGHTVTALVRANAPYREAVAAHAASVVTANPSGFYDMVAAWHIRRMLKRQRPDIILAHNGRAIALLSFASRGMEIPLCGVSHSYKVKHAMRADALVVLSEHMRRHFAAAGYSRPLEIIPNSIRLPEKLPLRKRQVPVVIGALGRFTPEKGFADLLQALQALRQMGVDFILRLGGDGPEMPNLWAQAEVLGLMPFIQWEGWVKDKASFYAGLDMLCMPSREDSFPLVALEALAHGLPLVATDAPGPASILTDGTDGLLVPRRDTQAMAAALQRLALQPELATQLAQAARKTAESYDFEVVAKRWDEVLNGVIAAAGSRQAA